MEIGVVDLVRAAWVAATLPVLVASIPSSRLNAFHQTLLLFAGRGKTFQASSPKLTVPQKFFTHFYVVAVLSTSILLLTTGIYAYETGSLPSDSTSYSTTGSYKTHSSFMNERCKAWRSVFLLLLMEVQALRRLYECLCLFKYSAAAKMHVFGYLTGLFFYSGAPLSLCVNCAPEALKYVASRAIEVTVKGKTQMPGLEFNRMGHAVPLVELGWCQLVGAAIFLWGSVHQYRSHAILGKLREGKEQADVYLIPRGDWFELVSSPHYLAEMVIYAGVVVASGGMDVTVWLLYGFVVANLVLAAAETHRWYRRKFDNYPSNRCAVIPGVY